MGLELLVLGSDVAGAWWSDQDGGIMGGVLGGVIGGFGGGVIGGCGMPLMIHKLRSKTGAMGIVWGLGLTGVVSLALFGVALADGQPYGVRYPLVLVGGIMTLLGVNFTFVVRQQFRAVEARRVESELIRGSGSGGAGGGDGGAGGERVVFRRELHVPTALGIAAVVAAVLLGMSVLGFVVFGGG